METKPERKKLTVNQKIGIGITFILIISIPTMILLNQKEEEEIPALDRMKFRFFNSISYEEIKENISFEIYKFQYPLYDFHVESDDLLFSQIEDSFELKAILTENLTFLYNKSLNEEYICHINITNYLPYWHFLSIWNYVEIHNMYVNKNFTDVAMNITDIPTDHVDYIHAKAIKFIINDSDSCIPNHYDLEQNTQTRPYLILNFTNITRPGDFDFDFLFKNNLSENRLPFAYCYIQNKIVLILNTIKPNMELWFRYSENNELNNISLYSGPEFYYNLNDEITHQEI